MEKYKKLLIAIAIVAGAWLIGYITGRNYVREATTVVQVDTVIKHDTIRVPSPVEIRYEKLTETLILPKVDTLRLRDTIYLVVNKEIKEYRDSLYYARVSGYQPNLDYIEVYPKTVVISKTETTTQSVTKCNTLALGAELQYNGTTYIPIYLEYSHLLHKNVEMFGKVMYDFPSKQIGVGMGMQIQFGW